MRISLGGLEVLEWNEYIGIRMEQESILSTYDGRNLIMTSPSPVAAAPPTPFST